MPPYFLGDKSFYHMKICLRSEFLLTAPLKIGLKWKITLGWRKEALISQPKRETLINKLCQNHWNSSGLPVITK